MPVVFTTVRSAADNTGIQNDGIAVNGRFDGKRVYDVVRPSGHRDLKKCYIRGASSLFTMIYIRTVLVGWELYRQLIQMFCLCIRDVTIDPISFSTDC